jgi:hypothetical protein
MPVLNYVDGYNGTMRVGSTEFSVENWSATLSGGMTEVAASKNGGWIVHRRGMKRMTGSASIVYESDVNTITGAGPVPANTVCMSLVAESGEQFVGNFVIGEATFNWDPNQPAKISLTFGNADAITTLPG